MSSNKKRFSLRLAAGLSLGLAGSGVVYATGPITDTFATGNTLTATHMNNLKNAVNDLQGNVPSTSCRTNAGAVDTGAVRVGTTCVDTVRQGASTSWTDAVTFCTTAGKRLPTPGEYMAAKNQDGAGFGMNTNGEFEWVDSVASNNAADGVTASGFAGRLTGSYMGPGLSTTTPAQVPVDGDIFYASNAAYDSGFAYIYFRCAR